jgi:hypothetical protein
MFRFRILKNVLNNGGRAGNIVKNSRELKESGLLMSGALEQVKI